MKKICMAILGCLLIWPLGAAADTLSIGNIMDGIEARYDVRGISVRFLQISTLKAMDITDNAEGRIYIKQPGRMRWEYEIPEKKAIITDGEQVWIYAPEDNQVTIGTASAFFGEGKGGIFLSDMTAIRKHFSIALLPDDTTDYYTLELVPKEKTGDLKRVWLIVSKQTFTIIQVVTQNPYGDETRLTFSELDFDQDLADDLFTFSPPEGTDVLSIGE